MRKRAVVQVNHVEAYWSSPVIGGVRLLDLAIFMLSTAEFSHSFLIPIRRASSS